MAINGMKPQGPPKILGLLTGFATGGGFSAGGMGAGLKGAGMAAVQGSGAPIGKVAGLYGTLDKVGAFDGDSPSPIDKPEIGSQFSDAGRHDAISKKLSVMGHDPVELRNQTLAMLQDPSIPQEMRDEFAPQLLRHKYYGYKSGGNGGY